MFKRVTWMGMGTVFGFLSSFYVNRKVKRAAERYLPERVVTDVTDKVKGVGSTVGDAWSEGRAAMRDTEVRLRRELGSRD